MSEESDERQYRYPHLQVGQQFLPLHRYHRFSSQVPPVIILTSQFTFFNILIVFIIPFGFEIELLNPTKFDNF